MTLMTNGYSQDPYSSIALRIRNPKDAYGITDSAGKTGFIFEGHKQYHVALLDSTGKEYKNYIVNKTSGRRKEVIIGGNYGKDNFIVYLYNKRYNYFSSLILNTNTGDYHYSDLKKLPDNEQYLRSFSMGDKFYILSVPKQKNILHVYSIEGGAKIKESVYGIEMSTFYASLNVNNNLLNEVAESTIGIETVRTRLDNNIKSAYPKKKLYYEQNKIYMTFDDPNATHLIVVDLDSTKSYYKKLNFSLEEGNNSPNKKGNSFLYDHKIFRATINPLMMNITVIDLDSMTMVNSYNIYPEKEIEILNGPIVQEGGVAFVPTEERVLHRTKQYFNRVLNGNISIAANRVDSNKVEVEVGSYEEIEVRGANSFGTPGFSFSMGMGMGMGGGFGLYNSPWSMLPYRGLYGYPGYYPYSSPTTRLRIVSFKTLLKDPDYRHIQGEAPLTIREKINQFIENNFRSESPELYTITSLNEKKLLMGYYRKTRNRFDVVSFDRLAKDEQSN